MFKQYLMMTKPGIIAGNLVTAIAGYLLASRGTIQLPSFLGLLFGLTLMIGSSCIFNNYQDRYIDAKMTRTQSRALVTEAISEHSALRFGAVLLGLSSLIFFYFTNLMTLCVALVGFIVYVGVYTPLKKRSHHATVVGSIAGSIAPVCGYVSVTHQLDLCALILFAMQTAWQMPHFYAISIFRFHDYLSAKVPVLAVTKGFTTTKIHMTVYAAAFALLCTLPSFFSYAGKTYLVTAMVLGATWLGCSALGFFSTSDVKWAKMMFRISLIVITTLSVVMSIDYI